MMLGFVACKPTPKPNEDDQVVYENPVQLPMPVAEKGHIRLVPPLFLPASLGDVVPEQTEFIVEVLFFSEKMLVAYLNQNQLDRFVILNRYTPRVNLFSSNLNISTKFNLSHTTYIHTAQNHVLTTSVNALGISTGASGLLTSKPRMDSYNESFPQLSLVNEPYFYVLFIASFEHPTNPELRYYFALNRHTIADFTLEAPLNN
jgi:hypothetical protein